MIKADNAPNEVALHMPTTGPRPPTPRYAAMQARIIAAAVAEINAQGVRGMSIAGVAQRLGLGPTGIIYYFRSKEDLAAAALLKAIEQHDGLIAASEAAPPGDARVQAFICGYFACRRRIADGTQEDVAYFNDVRALNRSDVNVAYLAMYRRGRRLVASAHDHDNDCATTAARNCRAVLLHAQVFWILGWLHRWEPQDYDRVGRRMADLVTGGLLPDLAPLPATPWPHLPTFAPAAVQAGDDDPAAEAFLLAATQLINEEGYHGASIERIAGRLNLTKGAFYHRNATKDDLVVACFQRSFTIMWGAIRAAENGGGSGAQVLIALVSALVTLQISGTPLLRTSAFSSVPETIRWGMLIKLNRITLRFSSILSDGIADGSLRPVDVAIAAELVMAAVNAASELPFWTPGITQQTAVTHYVQPLFMGMRR